MIDFEEFWKIISEAYNCDGAILQYANFPNRAHGDTLAKFIVSELADIEYLDEAIGRMERARDQIVDIISALAELENDE